MSTRRITCLWLGLLALPGLSGCAVSTTARVVAFGDSVTWGFGGRPGGWVTELEDLWTHPISNQGVPGETSEGAADRIESRLGLSLAPNADVVLILHGGNDMNQAFHRAPCRLRCDPALVDEKFEEIGRNLERIRDVAENHGRRTVFVTYWPPSNDACSKYDAEEFATFAAFVTRLNDEIVELAAASGSPVVHLDDLLDFPDDPDNYYDCLHPSAQGYKKIAQRFMQDRPLWEPESLDPWEDS